MGNVSDQMADMGVVTEEVLKHTKDEIDELEAALGDFIHRTRHLDIMSPELMGSLINNLINQAGVFRQTILGETTVAKNPGEYYYAQSNRAEMRAALLERMRARTNVRRIIDPTHGGGL